MTVTNTLGHCWLVSSLIHFLQKFKWKGSSREVFLFCTEEDILFVGTLLASEFANHVDNRGRGQLQSDKEFCLEDSLPVVNLFLCSEGGGRRGGAELGLSLTESQGLCRSHWPSCHLWKVIFKEPHAVTPATQISLVSLSK